MDSLTQIVLGAGVAEAMLGRQAGNKAILWGAIAGTLPDLDVIPAQWMSTVDALAFHRGISHSLLFALLLSPLLGWLVHRLYRQKIGSIREWSLLFFFCLFTHALLDCFTTWGVQLFWPLAHRIAWKTIFVIDPFYTLPFLFCLIWLMTKRRQSSTRRRLLWVGIGISSAYLAFTVVNKILVNRVFERALAAQKIEAIRYETRPTPLQNLLWAANVETEDAFYTGYYSWLDDDQSIAFRRLPKKQQLPPAMADQPAINKLKALTKGWYNLSQPAPGQWILNDLRFGQLGDYQGQEGEYVFSYLISRGGEGKLNISERETTRPEKGAELLRRLWQRIMGTANPGQSFE